MEKQRNVYNQSIMEDTEWLSARNGSSTSSTEVVAKVIHEYDIIDDNDHNEDSKMHTDKMKDRNTNSKSHIDTDTQPFQLAVDDIYKDSDSSTEDQTDTFVCPRVNCPEKIVICMDLSTEMDNETFRSRAGDKWTPFKLVKRALSFFLHSKYKMSKDHMYALAIITETTTWWKDFTSNIREILTIIEELKPTFECDTLDLSSVFNVIYDNVDVPSAENDVSILPPPYVVRTLLLLGRSHCKIENKDKTKFRTLESSPYFNTDVLFIHEPPSEENKCEEAFDRLCELDEKGISYILEASRNPTKLYDQMAQLLAHPLQRPLQGDTSYRLLNMADVAENLPP